MSQPVKLSDQLVLEARLAGKVMQRSIASQVEFWAQLGMALDPVLSGRLSKDLIQSRNSVKLSEIFATVDTNEGRARVFDYLQTLPFPHFEASDKPGLLVRIDADGKRTLGRFVNKQFVPAKGMRKK